MEIGEKKIYCSAGVLLSNFISAVLEKGYAGLEALSGIPGTIGGAIYGNAGAYGHSVGEFVKKVIVFDGKKERAIDEKDCRFGYRTSTFKGRKWIILGAEFVFANGDKIELEKKSAEIIDVRWKKFGPKPKCPGSYFKNVPVKDIPKKGMSLLGEARVSEGKIPAGYLLELAGAKGMRVGDIYVSDFHGNIILNGGEGKFRDLMKLVKKLKVLIEKKFGIKLEEEVIYVGLD